MWKRVMLSCLPISPLVDLVGEYVFICEMCENPMVSTERCPSRCRLPFCSKECVEKHQQDPTHQRTCTTCGTSSCHRTRCTLCKLILCETCVHFCHNCGLPYHTFCATQSWICEIRGCWSCGEGTFCKIQSCIQCKQKLLICEECCPRKSCPNGWVYSFCSKPK